MANYTNEDILTALGIPFEGTGCDARARVNLTVNAGDTGDVTDNSNGEEILQFNETLHFWSNDGSIQFTVGPGSNVVEAHVDPSVLPMPVSVVNSIDLKPTGNPNELTVEIVYTDDNGVQQTVTDTTPIVMPEKVTVETGCIVDPVSFVLADGTTVGDDTTFPDGTVINLSGATGGNLSTWFGNSTVTMTFPYAVSNITVGIFDVDGPGELVSFLADGNPVTPTLGTGAVDQGGGNYSTAPNNATGDFIFPDRISELTLNFAIGGGGVGLPRFSYEGSLPVYVTQDLDGVEEIRRRDNDALVSGPVVQCPVDVSALPPEALLDTFGTVTTNNTGSLVTTNGVTVGINDTFVQFPDGTTWASDESGSSSVIPSTETGNTMILGDDGNPYSMPFIEERCYQGEFDNTTEEDNVITNFNTVNLQIVTPVAGTFSSFFLKMTNPTAAPITQNINGLGGLSAVVPVGTSIVEFVLTSPITVTSGQVFNLDPNNTPLELHGATTSNFNPNQPVQGKFDSGLVQYGTIPVNVFSDGETELLLEAGNTTPTVFDPTGVPLCPAASNVESVDGLHVDNTDPSNPIVKTWIKEECYKEIVDTPLAGSTFTRGSIDVTPVYGNGFPLTGTNGWSAREGLFDLSKLPEGARIKAIRMHDNRIGNNTAQPNFTYGGVSTVGPNPSAHPNGVSPAPVQYTFGTSQLIDAVTPLVQIAVVQNTVDPTDSAIPDVFASMTDGTLTNGDASSPFTITGFNAELDFELSEINIHTVRTYDDGSMYTVDKDGNTIAPLASIPANYISMECQSINTGHVCFKELVNGSPVNSADGNIVGTNNAFADLVTAANTYNDIAEITVEFDGVINAVSIVLEQLQSNNAGGSNTLRFTNQRTGDIVGGTFNQGLLGQLFGDPAAEGLAFGFNGTDGATNTVGAYPTTMDVLKGDVLTVALEITNGNAWAFNGTDDPASVWLVAGQEGSGPGINLRGQVYEDRGKYSKYIDVDGTVTYYDTDRNIVNVSAWEVTDECFSDGELARIAEVTEENEIYFIETQCYEQPSGILDQPYTVVDQADAEGEPVILLFGNRLRFIPAEDMELTEVLMSIRTGTGGAVSSTLLLREFDSGPNMAFSSSVAVSNSLAFTDAVFEFTTGVRTLTAGTEYQLIAQGQIAMETGPGVNAPNLSIDSGETREFAITINGVQEGTNFQSVNLYSVGGEEVTWEVGTTTVFDPAGWTQSDCLLNAGEITQVNELIEAALSQQTTPATTDVFANFNQGNNPNFVTQSITSNATQVLLLVNSVGPIFSEISQGITLNATDDAIIVSEAGAYMVTWQFDMERVSGNAANNTLVQPVADNVSKGSQNHIIALGEKKTVFGNYVTTLSPNNELEWTFAGSDGIDISGINISLIKL